MEDPKIRSGGAARPAAKAKGSAKVAKSAEPPKPAAPAKAAGGAKLAGDGRQAANRPPAHDDGGEHSWGAPPAHDRKAERQMVEQKLAILAKRGDVQGVDIAESCQTLMAKMGGAQNALGLVIAARGGEAGVMFDPEVKLAALIAVANELGGGMPPSEGQLRDMDHWLNSYYAVHEGSFGPNRDDGVFSSIAKTVGREGTAVAGSLVVGGYSGAKAIAQWTGFDALKLASGNYSGNGQNTSKTDFNEVYYGLSGLFHGAFDTGADH